MPAGSEPARPVGPTPPALPHTWRPMGVRYAVVGFGLMLFVVCAAAWFGFDDSVRERFNLLQRLTLLVMGAGCLLAHLLRREPWDQMLFNTAQVVLLAAGGSALIAARPLVLGGAH